MTVAYSPAEVAMLAAELREDDARMTGGRWLNHGATVMHAPGDGSLFTIAEVKSWDGREANAAHIARLRNNARLVADQLDAAAAEIRRLDAIVTAWGGHIASMRTVVETSCSMREAESASAIAIDEDSAARPSRTELYAKALVAGARTKQELDRWRVAVDAYRKANP